MQQPHNQDHQDAPSSSTRSQGLAPVALGLLAGVVWGLKSRRQSAPQAPTAPAAEAPSVEKKPSDTPWVLGILGAGIAGAAVGFCRNAPQRFDARGQSDVRLSSQVTINRPPAEVYRYWEDVRNLPQAMSFLKSVEPQEGNISHWVARVPPRQTIEWDAEVVIDKPGEQLSWHSLEGSELNTWGTVTFKPSAKGKATKVTLVFNFSPPDNAKGTVARFMSGLESAALEHDLYQLKTELEDQGLALAH